MREVGFEPTRISTADLKAASLTTRTSSLFMDVFSEHANLFGPAEDRTRITRFKVWGPDH